MSNENIEMIKKAYHFAEKAHQGQMRSSGDPYIIHPTEVAQILADLRLDLSSINCIHRSFASLNPFRDSSYIHEESQPLRRGFSLRVTPVPIPNTAVKPRRADDTALLSVGK